MQWGFSSNKPINEYCICMCENRPIVFMWKREKEWVCNIKAISGNATSLLLVSFLIYCAYLVAYF